MASSKRIGFFWGEERVTLVEFEKNSPLRVVSSALDSKTNISSPFSSNFTEEIQLTAVLQKMLQDNRIMGGSFYVSLPMKEIILRSFVIPLVKREDIHNAIKFEAKKYLPIDIQGLAFVFYTIPFMENKIKRLQIVFFAARKESLERYERIFKQVNAVVSYCEPCMVSLTKVLLFKKEITPTDHLAFLILDKNLGRICFIDQGIPQFIREFSISSHSPSEETANSPETLNFKIVNEVGNSFDFYARQFSQDRMDQMLVSSETAGQDLLNALEIELKIKLRKISSVITLGAVNDVDTIYAMGAGIEPPMASLSGFNLLQQDITPKSQFKGDVVEGLKASKEIIFVFLISMVFLVGTYIFFQVQLKVDQKQYDQLSSKLGGFMSVSVDSIQDGLKDNTDKLAAYKNIRTKSNVVFIVLRIASHLPHGALLKQLNVSYNEDDSNNAQLNIAMKGEVFREDPNEEIGIVDQISSDFKNDKELARFIKSVDLVALNREGQVTEFEIHCS